MKKLIRSFSTSSGDASISTLHVRGGIQLKPFREALAKINSTTPSIHTINASTTALSLDLVTRLLGSVVGVEGCNVFPIVMNGSSDQGWVPSPMVLDHVQLILEKKTLSTNHPIEDIVNVVRDDSRVGSKGMLKQKNAVSSAGWRYSDKQWIQYQGLADLCLFGLSQAQARESVERFTNVTVPPLTTGELASLGTNNGQTNVAFRTPTPVHYHSLGIFYNNRLNNSLSSADMDSHAILYSAASLLNQAFLHDFDEPQIAYSMIHTGKTWRFVAFQLNNMMINANHDQEYNWKAPSINIANATWIYESELFHKHSETGKLIVNPEPLMIMHDILQGSGATH